MCESNSPLYPQTSNLLRCILHVDAYTKNHPLEDTIGCIAFFNQFAQEGFYDVDLHMYSFLLEEEDHLLFYIQYPRVAELMTIEYINKI